MAADDVKTWSEARRDIPSQRTAGTLTPRRCSLYGEDYVESLLGSKMHALADEGQYFVAVHPTPGTGIAGHAAPTDITVDTKALVFMRNTSSGDSLKRVYIDYIHLQVTAAGTAGSDVLYKLDLDTGATRWSSGGTAITPSNVNMASATASAVTVYAGAATVAAETSSVRQLQSGLIRSAINVVGDSYIFDFGASHKAPSSMIVAGTAIASLVIPCPPIVLGGTDQLLLHFAATSQSAAASYYVNIGFWQR